MLGETSLVFILVLGAIKTLYQLRGQAVIGEYLSTFVAILLIYPAVIHTSLRKLPVTFFEKNLAAIGRSFLVFFAAALAIYPLFLLGNHFYQTRLFGLSLQTSALKLPLENVVVQVVLVAFPEEFFFRGYLQTMLARRFHRRFHLPGLRAISMGWAVPLASLIFALSHSFITVQWWHIFIFFPSLVFGWLREKTQGLVAPILFHATSNVLVMLIGRLYL